MSCCADCSQGFDCGSGMYGLMGALVAAGSEVKLGFEYGLQTTSEEAFQGYGDPSYVQSVLKGALEGAGLFQYVTVTITPPAYAGLQHGYILIQGVLWQDVPYIGEIQSIAKGLITDYLPTVVVTRDDPIHVLSVPQGRQDATQPFDPTRTNQSGQPAKCDWDSMSFGDYVACQLGIDSPIGGATVGAVGGLVGAALITLLAITFLKR